MNCNEQWLMVSDWECQDLYAAGSGTGLDGRRLRSCVQLVELLMWLQAAARDKGKAAVGYVLRQPVVMDAAKVGSRAHIMMPRNLWTKLGEPMQITAAARSSLMASTGVSGR